MLVPALLPLTGEEYNKRSYFKEGKAERRVGKPLADAGRVLRKRVLVGYITQGFRFLTNIDGWVEIKENAKERSMCVQRLSQKLSPSKASQKEVAVGSKVVIKEGNRPSSLGPWKSPGQACLGDEHRLLLS